MSNKSIDSLQEPLKQIAGGSRVPRYVNGTYASAGNAVSIVINDDATFTSIKAGESGLIDIMGEMGITSANVITKGMVIPIPTGFLFSVVVATGSIFICYK